MQASAADPAGLVVDTDVIDSAWARLAPDDEACADLNAVYDDDTSVEALAARWLHWLRSLVPEVTAVTVWEDDERWGRAVA